MVYIVHVKGIPRLEKNAVDKLMERNQTQHPEITSLRNNKNQKVDLMFELCWPIF